MSLITDYNDLVDQILQYNEDVEYNDAEAEACKAQYEAVEESIAALKADELSENSSIIKKLIAKELKEREQKFRVDAEKLRTEISNLKDQYNENKTRAILEVNSATRGTVTLREVFNYIQSTKPSIQEYAEELEAPVETYGQLKNRMKEFKKSYKEAQSTPEPLCFSIAEKVALTNFFTEITNPRLAILLMTVYLAIIVALLMLLPVIAIPAYCAITVLSIKGAIRKEYTDMLLSAEFKLLELSYQNCESAYSEDYALRSKEAQDLCEKEYKESLQYLQSKQTQLMEAYQRERYNVTMLEKDTKYVSEHLTVYRDKLAELEEELQMLKENYQDALETCKVTHESIADLSKEKEDLKKEIINHYISDLQPGTDRIITKELFIGFNEEDKAVTLAYNADSTVIMYSGETASSITDLVMMIFVQILCNTNIASLVMHIFETEQGAPRFAPFTQKELGDCVVIHSTKAQCLEAIKSLHRELEIRNKQILSYADNIEAYNREMLAKNSLTMDYKVLLIQDSGGAIYDNKEFEQICKSGPTVGIIPIIFIQQNHLFEVCQKGEQDWIKKYLAILSAISTTYYKYVSEKKVLSAYTPDFRSALLNRIQKSLK